MLLRELLSWFLVGAISTLEEPFNTTCSGMRLYYPPKQTCLPYNVSHPRRGPCPAGLIFTKVSSESSLGECACSGSESVLSGRVAFYRPKEKRCHHIFTRGPCGAGQWIDYDVAKGPFCADNPCKQLPRPVIVFDGNRTCRSLGETCRMGLKHTGTIEFVRGDIYPVCSKHSRSLGAVTSTCAEGTYRTHDGHQCVVPINFELDF